MPFELEKLIAEESIESAKYLSYWDASDEEIERDQYSDWLENHPQD